MSEPFIGEVRMFANSYVPRGWLPCNGQLVSISENTALFSILGINFGGDGRSTFGLPNLQGKVPIGAGTGPGLEPKPLSYFGGSEGVVLHETQMPAHNHTFTALNENADTNDPKDAYLAKMGKPGRRGRFTAVDSYANAPGNSTMSDSAVTETGGDQMHENRQPALTVTFAIATTGIYPPRS